MAPGVDRSVAASFPWTSVINELFGGAGEYRNGIGLVGIGENLALSFLSRALVGVTRPLG